MKVPPVHGSAPAPHTPQPLSVYLHIPFCVRKCAYCDFPSYAGCAQLLPAYVDALIDEIQTEARRWPNRIVQTVFWGGGTPSLLSGEQMLRLMEALRRAFPIAPGAEISMEANPGTLTAQSLSAYLRAGINRLSIGVQAFDDRLLQRIGRIHTRQQAVDALLMAHQVGFRNLNVDLMYGLPDQSLADFSDTLHTLLSLPVTHVSLYSLIVEEGTPLHARVAAGEALPDDEATLEMQHMAARLLSAHGLERYEISNYARAGCECRHNLTYWQRGEYLGLGCAAHSMMEDARFSNTASLEEYLHGVRRVETERLTERDALEETVMLGLRTTQGMDMTLYQALCADAFSGKRRTVDRLILEGLARLNGDRLSLTERGMDVLNAVIAALV